MRLPKDEGDKMADLFDVGHVAQLHEIQKARLKRNKRGIGSEVEELIQRLTSGGVAGKADDEREHQAKVLFDKGFGRELGFEMFEAYLESIPEIPEFPADDRFDRLILVDARLGLTKTCQLLGVAFNGSDSTFAAHTGDRVKAGVYWIRCQDGKRNCGKSVKRCREQFTKGEIGLNAHEGLAVFAQDPEVLQSHYIDLPSSVHSESCGSSAILELYDGRPLLFWVWHDSADSSFGSASRRD